jgi:hypothetical protein
MLNEDISNELKHKGLIVTDEADEASDKLKA